MSEPPKKRQKQCENCNQTFADFAAPYEFPVEQTSRIRDMKLEQFGKELYPNAQEAPNRKFNSYLPAAYTHLVQNPFEINKMKEEEFRTKLGQHNQSYFELACVSGNLELVIKLYSRFHELCFQHTNSQGLDPFFSAIQAKKTDVIKHILDYKWVKDINTPKEIRTLRTIPWADNSWSPKVERNDGESISSIDSFTFACSVQNQNEGIIKVLLDSGAEVKFKHLQWAVFTENKKVLALLWKQFKLRDRRTPGISIKAQEKELLRIKAQEKELLRITVKNKSLDMLKLLHEGYKLDYNQVWRDILLDACSIKGQKLELVRYLVENKAELSYKYKDYDEGKEKIFLTSALERAAGQDNNEEVCKYLLNMGESITNPRSQRWWFFQDMLTEYAETWIPKLKEILTRTTKEAVEPHVSEDITDIFKQFLDPLLDSEHNQLSHVRETLPKLIEQVNFIQKSRRERSIE